MRALLVLVVAAVVAVGCTLRPRYADFFTKETTEPVKLQVTEKNSGLAVAGALVEVGELRGKVTVKTDPEGFFQLPVDKRLMDDNALIVVTAPKGVGRVQVQRAAAVDAPAVLPVPAVQETMPAPLLEVVDAGTGTGSGSGPSN